MRTTRLAIVCLATVLSVGGPASTSGQREPLVITTAWLAGQLNDPDLVLLHVGDKAQYDKRHIPSARFVTLTDISVTDRTTPQGLTLQMPAAEDLHSRLEALGISDRSRVVVYYGEDWVSPTTRVIFTLDYAGLGDRVSLLDGGMGAWVKDGHVVTDIAPPARTGSLSPLRVRPIVVDAEYVRAHLGTPGFVVIDARAPEFYEGTNVGGPKDRPHRAGHVAGALSVPFSQLTDEKLYVRPPDALAPIFTKAGVKAGDTIIGYCHIGQQATAMLFAARTLGYPVLLYDGSFEDWSRHPDYAVDGPSAKKD